MKFIIFCLLVGVVVVSGRKVVLKNPEQDTLEAFADCLNKTSADLADFNKNSDNLTANIIDHCGKSQLQIQNVITCVFITGYKFPKEAENEIKSVIEINEVLCRDPVVSAEQFTCLSQFEDFPLPLFKAGIPANTCIEWQDKKMSAAIKMNSCKVSPVDQEVYLSAYKKPDCEPEYQKFATCVLSIVSDLPDLEDIRSHEDLEKVIAESKDACKKLKRIDKVVHECNRQMGGMLEEVSWALNHTHIFCRDPVASAKQFHCLFLDKTYDETYPHKTDDCVEWRKNVEITTKKMNKCGIPTDAQFVYLQREIKWNCLRN